jgi:hypothetical protein
MEIIKVSPRTDLAIAIPLITIVIFISDLLKSLTLFVTTFLIPLNYRPTDFRNFLNQ